MGDSFCMKIWNADQIDGAITRLARYDGTDYLGGNDQDICVSALFP